MATLTQARRLFQRAHESGNWDKFGACIVELMKPPKPRKGTSVIPAPTMLTTFADGRICRMSIAQRNGDPLPVERAKSIARGVYHDHISPIVPAVTSCELVSGEPVPENCGLIRWRPSEATLFRLGQHETGTLPKHYPRTPGIYNGVDYADTKFDPWRDEARASVEQIAA